MSLLDALIMDCIEEVETARESKHPSPPDICPSCHHQGDFEYIGEQHWPEEVAARMGIAPTTALWRCGNCHTSIMGSDDA